MHYTEPGYYEDGQFGIRIENVVVVKNADTKVSVLVPRPLAFMIWSLHSTTLEGVVTLPLSQSHW